MQKKLRLGLAAVLLFALLGTGASASGPRDKDDDDVLILRLTLTTDQEAELDLGPPGLSLGDRFINSGEVLRRGERIGVSGLECATVRFTPGPDPAGQPEALVDQCFATLSLPRGQITVQGLVDRLGPVPVTLAITGGTGAFRTAHGELKTSGPDEEGNEPVTLKVIL